MAVMENRNLLRAPYWFLNILILLTKSEPARKYIFRKNIGVLLFLLVFLILVIIYPAVTSANNTINLTLDSAVSYTNNVALTPDNEISSGIFEFTPGISGVFDGRKMNAVIDYRLENYYFAEDGGTGLDQYQYYNQLSAGSDGELFDNVLFLKTDFSIYQYVSTSSGLIVIDNSSLVDDRTTAERAALSPYVQSRIGAYGNFRLDYTYDHQTYDGDDTENININEYVLAIDSGEKFNKTKWYLNSSISDLDYEISEDQQFSYVEIGADYNLAAGTLLLATAGYEKNEYQVTGDPSTEGEYWSAGVSKGFGRRANVLLRYGEHYYGPVAEVELSHRSRYVLWSVSYIDEVTTNSFLEAEATDIDIPESIAGVDAISDGLSVFLRPVLTSEAIIRRTASFDIDAEYRKLSGHIRLSSAEYDYQETDEDEVVNVASIGVIWKFAPRMEIGLSELYQTRSIENIDFKEDAQRAELTLSYLLSSKASLSMSGLHSWVNSDIETNEFSQDLVTLGLHLEF